MVPDTKKNKEGNLVKIKILEAGAKLFYEQGYDNATTRELARSAGISNAGVYYHFKDKEDILYNIIDSAVIELCNSVNDVVNGDDDPEKNLTRIIDVMVKVVVENRISIGIILRDEHRLNARRLEQIDSKRKKVLFLIKEELKKLDTQGRLRPCDLTTVAFSLVGITNWTFFWYDPNGPLTVNELSAEMEKLFLMGVLKR